MARPIGLGLAPLFPLALVAQRPSWTGWSRLTLLYALGLAVVLAPWLGRNYLVLGGYSGEGAVGTTLVGRTVRHDGFTFVDPVAPALTANPSGTEAERRQRARELMQEAASKGSFITPLRRRLMQELGLTELQANQLMRDLAIEAILRQPGYYALSSARFFGQLALGWPERVREAWQSRRDAESREEWESHPEIAPLLGPPRPIQERQLPAAERLAGLYQPGRYGALVLALFALGALAALVGPPARRAALLPALFALALIGVGVAFVGPVLRYRDPAEPFLAVLAAGGLVTLLSLAARPGRRSEPGRTT
jgi:hypothetical protein